MLIFCLADCQLNLVYSCFNYCIAIINAPINNIINLILDSLQLIRYYVNFVHKCINLLHLLQYSLVSVAKLNAPFGKRSSQSSAIYIQYPIYPVLKKTASSDSVIIVLIGILQIWIEAPK